MRFHAALAALVAAPFVAVAQVPAASSSDATLRDQGWSFGGGVAFEWFALPVSSFGGTSGLISSSAIIPAVGASLERRLSGRTWLALGVVRSGRAEPGGHPR